MLFIVVSYRPSIAWMHLPSSGKSYVGYNFHDQRDLGSVPNEEGTGTLMHVHGKHEGASL